MTTSPPQSGRRYEPRSGQYPRRAGLLQGTISRSNIEPADLQQEARERYLFRSCQHACTLLWCLCLPSARAARTTASHLARCRRGTISAKTTCPMVIMPLPPIPLRHRPPSSAEKFSARAQIIEPALKKTSEACISFWPPKMSERSATKGCKTAEDKGYEVPA